MIAQQSPYDSAQMLIAGALRKDQKESTKENTLELARRFITVGKDGHRDSERKLIWSANYLRTHSRLTYDHLPPGYRMKIECPGMYLGGVEGMDEFYFATKEALFLAGYPMVGDLVASHGVDGLSLDDFLVVAKFNQCLIDFYLGVELTHEEFIKEIRKHRRGVMRIIKSLGLEWLTCKEVELKGKEKFHVVRYNGVLYEC